MTLTYGGGKEKIVTKYLYITENLLKSEKYLGKRKIAMNRYQKLKINTLSSLFNRLILIISGFILPRFILSFYGSETNGLVSSINQFLTIITFLDLGVGSVVQSALYGPLADRNYEEIAGILESAKNYFRKIAYVLLVYVFLLIVFSSSLLDNDGSFFSTAFLIVSISIGLFSQYYFGIVNELLLNADQKSYIQFTTENIVVLLNLIVSLVLIVNGFSIQLVKLISGVIFLIRPIYLAYYVTKNYRLNSQTNISKKPLPQKWSGMAQHIAYSVQKSSDIIILTILTSLSIVSIYSVYNLIVQGLQMLISSITVNLKSYYGNLLVTENSNVLIHSFERMEWIVHTGVTFLYAVSCVLIVPFVMIYTSGIEDVNYYQPIFGYLFVIGNMFYSLRTPYQTLILAAGHFKQTQVSSIIEVVINIIVSVLMVIKFGLIGVGIGTSIAMLYRTIYLAFYLKDNILKRPLKTFFKHMFVDSVIFLIISLLGTMVLNNFSIETIGEWAFIACLISLVGILTSVLINLFFYKNYINMMLNKIGITIK
ncbi:lipopolysaccharide biosynthesis protein [Aerococcus urinaeequi]|uniref:lipopolysaccharide biosynthesis protein n=1 Tax=Aerococcus urinaeequi TaxID=51665 RepID=UPI003B4A8F60